MEATPELIVDFAAQRAREIWDAKQEPYLLALLGPELKAREIDYKAALGQIRLKEFFQSQGGNKVKLVSHPGHRSKIGLIPSNENFEYKVQDHANDAAAEVLNPPQVATNTPRTLKSRYIVLDFLQLLSSIPKEEAEKVQIPASVLAMLIKVR